MLLEYTGRQAAVNFILRGMTTRIGKGNRILLSPAKVAELKKNDFFNQLVKKKEIVITDLEDFDRGELVAMAKSFNVDFDKKDTIPEIIQKMQGNPTGKPAAELEAEQAAAAEAAKQAEQAKIDEAVSRAVAETKEKAEAEKIKAIADAVKQAQLEAAEDEAQRQADAVEAAKAEAKREAEADAQRQAEAEAEAEPAKPATKKK